MVFLRRFLLLLLLAGFCQSAVPVSNEEMIATAQVVDSAHISPSEIIPSAQVVETTTRQSWFSRTFGCCLPFLNSSAYFSEAVAEPALQEAMVVSIQATYRLESESDDEDHHNADYDNTLVPEATSVNVSSPGAPAAELTFEDYRFLEDFLSDEERLEAYTAEMELFYGGLF